MKKLAVLLVHLRWLLLLPMIVNCQNEDLQPNRSYSGHQIDLDANNFVRAYPHTIGTRLDNCQTCHRAGVKGTDTEAKYNACDYCHLIPFPDGKYLTGVPEDFEQTLNSYGIAYKKAGRSEKALFAIKDNDMDEDGYSNDKEIKELYYPGDPTSKPGQPHSPIKILTFADLLKIKRHQQTLLMNKTKQQKDVYVQYSGVKIMDIFFYLNIDMTGASGITVFAPDGFSKDYGIDDILNQFPSGVFYQTPVFNDEIKELLTCPDILRQRYEINRVMNDSLWLMVATERDSINLMPVAYQSKTGKISGEGPFRTIYPQKHPGRPDRSSKSAIYNDGWDYDESLDHNAGESVRGMCVIRINPMLSGFEEYDWKNGWSLIAETEIIIYGHGVSEK